MAGWQLSVILKPARQTSGDFYDFIALPSGKLGIVVADVADKGAAAALFMATCQSLIRTYAGEFIDQPEEVVAAASRRMLADTHAGLFVTVFYGVLDPESGDLVYCNAGHTPAISLSDSKKYQTLPRTGPPLGVFDDVNWESSHLQFNPGDSVVLYSDGVTEAQNQDEEFFGEKGLLTSLKHNQDKPAEELRDAVLADLEEFSSGASQFDDITLMILSRDTEA
jgi:serine phosphatase RsbU (regulator of sigma subunit)